MRKFQKTAIFNLTFLIGLVTAGTASAGPIHDAAKSGNTNEVSALIQSGSSVNSRGSIGNSPLHFGASYGHTDLVTFLITSGANPTQLNDLKMSPLHLAANKGHLETVKILSSNKAGLNLQNKYGETPVFRASKNGHSEIVSYLVSQGANPNIKDEDGNTPAQIAAQKGHETIVSILGQLGADQNGLDASGNTLLHTSILDGNPDETSRLISARVDLNALNADGKAPLHIALEMEKVDIVAQLLSAGANPNVLTGEPLEEVPIWEAYDNPIGRSPLQMALADKKTKIADLLVSHGAKTDFTDSSGNSPFHTAVATGNIQLVKQLLASGASAKTPNSKGMAPIDMVSVQSQPEIVMMLISHGADPNARSIFKTYLHDAVETENHDLVELLLRKGANPNVYNLAKLTPLDLSYQYGGKKTRKLLREYGAKETVYTEKYEENGDLLGQIFTGALVGVGIGAVVSGDVDPETLNQIADTLSKGSTISGQQKYPTTTIPSTPPSNSKAILEANAKNRCVEITNSYIPAISAIPIGNSIREQAQNSIKRNNITLEGLNKCLQILPVGSQSYNEVYQQALAVKADNEQSLRIFNQVNVTDPVVHTQPDWSGTTGSNSSPTVNRCPSGYYRSSSGRCVRSNEIARSGN